MADPTTATVPTSGSVTDYPLEDILKDLCEQHRSALVRVASAGEPAQIEVEGGRVVSATYRGQEGDSALVRIISLTAGTFEVEFNQDKDIGEPADSHLGTLIVQAQKRRAKIETLTKSVGGNDRVLLVDMQRLTRLLDKIPDEVNPVLSVCDGRRNVSEIMAMSSFDEITTLRVIDRLLTMGVMTAADSSSLPEDLLVPSEEDAEGGVDQNLVGVMATEAGPEEQPDAGPEEQPDAGLEEQPEAGPEQTEDAQTADWGAAAEQSVRLAESDSASSPVDAAIPEPQVTVEEPTEQTEEATEQAEEATEQTEEPREQLEELTKQLEEPAAVTASEPAESGSAAEITDHADESGTETPEAEDKVEVAEASDEATSDAVDGDSGEAGADTTEASGEVRADNVEASSEAGDNAEKAQAVREADEGESAGSSEQESSANASEGLEEKPEAALDHNAAAIAAAEAILGATTRSLEDEAVTEDDIEAGLVAAEKENQVATSWVSQQMDKRGAPDSMVAIWNEHRDGASPVVARWTDFPQDTDYDDEYDVFGGAQSASSISSAFEQGDGETDGERDFSNWLEAEEAGFFEASSGQSLDYENVPEKSGRDIFPFALGIVFVALVTSGLGIYYWISAQDKVDRSAVNLERTEVESEDPRPRPMPLIIASDDEAKIQTPYEAAAEAAKGTLPDKSQTVLEIGAPVVTVLRDVEDLSAKEAKEKSLAEEIGKQELEALAASQPAVQPLPKDEPGQPDRGQPGQDQPGEKQPGQVKPAVAKPEQKPAPAVEPEQSPEERAKNFAVLYAEGTHLLKRERYKQALHKFEAAMLKDPGDSRVYVSIGQIYFEYGNLDKALSNYRKAEALAPKAAKVHLLMGLALHEAGRLDQARQHYQTYLKLAPDGTEATAVRGILETL